MTPAMIYELIGYLASALVVISLMMRSLLRLRVINLIGAFVFGLYGILIGAWPIVVTNFIIVAIDIYYLRDMMVAREYFKVLSVKADSDYLKYFLEFYRSEIATYLPTFSYRPEPGQLTLFVLRNTVPAGLFIATPLDADTLKVTLDFVIPGYRDFKIGSFIYHSDGASLRTAKARWVLAEAGTPKHASYLTRMGFRPYQDGIYRLELAPT